MKRKNYPSSKENIDRLIGVARSGKGLVAKQRKVLRDYLAGAVSSNEHTHEVAMHITEIREALNLKISGDRENRYVKDYREKQYNSKKSYHEKCTENGIEISVGWDVGHNDYTIYFPQIDLDYAWNEETSDQVIRITQLPDVAKQIYDYAVKQASQVKDVYELYRRVNAFKADFPYDEEDLEEFGEVA